MKSFLNSILVLISLLLIMPLILLALFNLGGGVDCVTYQGSSSCSAPEKVFYFPECKTDLIKYAEDERRLKEFKKAHPGPVSPGGGSPIVELKCGLHNYFHPSEAIFNSNNSESTPVSPSTSDNGSYKLSKEESDQAWEKLLSYDKDEKNSAQKNRSPSPSTDQERTISRFDEADKIGPAICNSVKNITMGVAEEVSVEFNLDPRGISFARSFYKPLDLSNQLFYILGQIGHNTQQVLCQIVIYTPNGVLNCYAMRSDINSGVISSVNSCFKP